SGARIRLPRGSEQLRQAQPANARDPGRKGTPPGDEPDPADPLRLLVGAAGLLFLAASSRSFSTGLRHRRALCPQLCPTLARGRVGAKGSAWKACRATTADRADPIPGPNPGRVLACVGGGV